MFPLAAASMISRRLIGRGAHGHFAPSIPNGLARSCKVRTSTQRSFNDWGSPIPEPEFTPGETMLLDVTAWFVALALVYTPNHHSQEMDEEHESTGRRLRTGKKNEQDSPRASGKDH